MSKNNKVDYSKVEVKDNMLVDKGNDIVEKEERKGLEPILNVAPKKTKRGLVGRLITGVLGPEGLTGIGAYVSEEIIVPAIKNIIVDAVTSGINMIMYGNKGGSGPTNYRSNVHHTPYGRHSAPPRPVVNYTSRYTSQQPEPTRTVGTNIRYGVEEYTIAERGDAAHVLTVLTEQADMYGSVAVADYYDLIGVPSEYTDNNYGWYLDQIAHTTIRPVRGGYVIKFPPAEVL